MQAIWRVEKCSLSSSISFFELLRQDVGVELLLGHIERIVVVVGMVLVVQPERQRAAVPVVPPLVAAHPEAGHAIDVEVVAESRECAESASGHPRAVGALQDELRFLRVDAAIEDDRVDVETAVDLRHLRRLAVGEGRVADLAHPAPLLAPSGGRRPDSAPAIRR